MSGEVLGVRSSASKVSVSKGYQVGIDFDSLKPSSMSFLSEHRKVGVYQADDGSITSFYQDDAGFFYFYRWCEQINAKSSLWLIAQVKNESAAEYFNELRTLSDLIVSSANIKLLEVSNDNGSVTYERLWDIPLKRIPQCYMPENRSFFSLLTAKKTMPFKDLFKLTKV